MRHDPVIIIRLSVACWLRWWLGSVALFSHMTGMTPDEEKVERMVGRAIKIKHDLT